MVVASVFVTDPEVYFYSNKVFSLSLKPMSTGLSPLRSRAARGAPALTRRLMILRLRGPSLNMLARWRAVLPWGSGRSSLSSLSARALTTPSNTSSHSGLSWASRPCQSSTPVSSSQIQMLLTPALFSLNS